MLVTHRGPYRFSVRDDGSFESRRGAGGLVSALLPLVQRDDIGGRPSWVAAWETLSAGDNVEAVVTGVNKGGLELKVGTTRAFMPAGQVDTKFNQDLSLRLKPDGSLRELVASASRAALVGLGSGGKNDLWNNLNYA